MNDRIGPDDPRSTWELVNIALCSNDEDAADSAYWDAMWALHRRGTADVFEAARSLCQSGCPQEQRIGCYILSQLGCNERPFAAQSFPLVAAVMKGTENLDTIASALCALGWFGDLRGVDIVLPFLEHADSDIRYWVVHALTAMSDDPRSIEGLIRLTTDSSPLVRDWATFGLGSQIEIDSPAIRAALVARLEDPDEVVRGEALVGLAKRQDERVIEPLRRELLAGTYHGSTCDFASEALAALDDLQRFPQLSAGSTNG